MSEPISPFDRPQYLEAVEKERVNRDASFMQINEWIGRFEVMPMTLRHYLILRTIGSPLLSGGTPTPLDVARFLWVLQPNYSTSPKARDKFLRKCRREFIPQWFNRQRKLNIAAEIIGAARRYVGEAFDDAAPPKKTAIIEKEYFSDAASICAQFAREYGWDDDVVLNKPIKRIFQYFKEQKQHREGSKAILFNKSEKFLMEGVA